MSDPIQSLADDLAERIAERLAVKLRPLIPPEADPFLTVQQSAKYLGLGRTSVERLIAAGFLKTAPGLIERRIRRSSLDNYGKAAKK